MSIFSQVAMTKPRYNTFNLSHDRKMSMNMGTLVPCLVMETVPGDTISLNTAALVRFAPMIAPIMHKVSVYQHFFFVPNRLLWKNWESFITGGEDGQDASVFPFINTTVSEGSIEDYIGLPSTGGQTIKVSAMPQSAMVLIYNEYYRDQNLISPQSYELVNGDNAAIQGSLSNLRRRAWQHDYFTSCLPFTQKGPEATIPLGSVAPINYLDVGSATTIRSKEGQWGATGDLDLEVNVVNTTDISGNAQVDVGGGTRKRVHVDNSAQLQADLSGATAASINELRRAFRLQEWLEKNARGGSRYIESILVHFGVKSSDARLQRPEFLGGSAQQVQFSEVLQTSETLASGPNTPQGNMAGHGISLGQGSGFKYTCEEHGYIIGIITVMPKTAYYQGIPKHFLKWDKFDYYWPSFARLGEQPVQNKELFTINDGADDDTFGYIPRYAEYKYHNSSVHGEFRTQLDFWHLGRKFGTRPALNGTFIACEPDTRIFADVSSNTNKLYCHIYHQIKATRPMPYFGTPTI